MRRGTCCKSRCEQSTVGPVHVQTRGHFWSMLLVPTFVFAELVPCTKMPTVPALLNVPNDESPFPYGISCNSKITKMVVVAFTAQLSGGLFIFDIIFHIWLVNLIVIWCNVVFRPSLASNTRCTGFKQFSLMISKMSERERTSKANEQLELDICSIVWFALFFASVKCLFSIPPNAVIPANYNASNTVLCGLFFFFLSFEFSCFLSLHIR